jgi:hypothetical protein
MRKPAITGLSKPQGLDDLIKPLAKEAIKKAKKPAKKMLKDVSDKNYKKNPYNAKGGLTKNYKDYVMRNSKGDY